MSCIFDDSFLYSSRFLSLSLHLLTSLEIPIHLFGVYLIYTKTPKTMNSAKNSIMQLHIACSLMDIYLTFFFVFYIWLPSPSGFPAGILSNFGVNPAIQFYIAIMIMLSVAISIVAFFENRYDSLVIGQVGRSSTRNIKRIVYFSLNAVSSSIFVGYVFWNLPDPEKARWIVHEWLPCIPLSLINHPMYVNINSESDDLPLVAGAMVIIITLQAMYFMIYTVYHIFFSVRNVSRLTQQIQKKFFIAMTLQALIPLVAFVCPIFYFLLSWRFVYYNQMYNNFAMIVIGFNGLLTTIVMILVHAPYRKSVIRMVGKGGEAVRNSRLFTKIPSRVIN